jgi:hypothetical protein
VFAFTFQQSGTYVFASSTDADAQTVVVVLPVGQSCTVVDGPMTPMTSAALVALGVSKASTPVLRPNWALLGGLVGGLVGVVVVIVGFIAYFRHVGLTHKGWRLGRRADAAAATSGKPRSTHSSNASKSSAGKGASKASGAAEGKAERYESPRRRVSSHEHVLAQADESQLDALDVEQGDGGVVGDSDEAQDYRALVERLKGNHADIAAAFAKQQGTLEDVVASLRREADAIKALLASAAASHRVDGDGDGSDNMRAALALRQVEAEVAVRAMYERMVAARQGELMAALHALDTAMRDESSALASRVVAEACGDAPSDGGAGVGAGAGAGVGVGSGSGSGDPALGVDDASRQQSVAVAGVDGANRSVSPTANAVWLATQAVTASIASLHSTVGVERDRRAQGLVIWRAVLTSCGEELTRQLTPAVTALAASVEPVDDEVRGMLRELDAFDSGARKFGTALWACVADVVREFAAASEKRNPAQLARVRSMGVSVASDLFLQLHRAVRQLLRSCTVVVSAVAALREASSSAQRTALQQVSAARERIDADVRDAQVSKSSAAQALKAINDLVDALRRGGISGPATGASGGSGDFETSFPFPVVGGGGRLQHADAGSVSSVSSVSSRGSASDSDSDSENEDDGLGDPAENEAQRQLVEEAVTAKVDEEVAAALAEVEASVDAIARQQEEQGETHDEEAREAVKLQVAALDSDAQRAAIMADFEMEREKLREAMEAERRRQSLEVGVGVLRCAVTVTVTFALRIGALVFDKRLAAHAGRRRWPSAWRRRSRSASLAACVSPRPRLPRRSRRSTPRRLPRWRRSTVVRPRRSSRSWSSSADVPRPRTPRRPPCRCSLTRSFSRGRRRSMTRWVGVAWTRRWTAAALRTGCERFRSSTPRDRPRCWMTWSGASRACRRWRSVTL